MAAIIYIVKHGLMWRDAPKAYGPHKAIYSQFINWSPLGVFSRIFAELAGKAGEPERIIDPPQRPPNGGPHLKWGLFHDVSCALKVA